MELDELLKEAKVEPTPILPPSSEDVEKVAQLLEACASEDTLVEELAKLAVVADFLKARNSGKESVV